METPLRSILLREAMFEAHEQPLLDSPGVAVSTFRYASGVAALRLVTERVELIVLPFRGQQVWRYTVDGEPLTMISTFDEPSASTAFGETYGGFLLHCGLSGLGAPGPEDTHPHHGELPNGLFSDARLLLGDGWVAVTGQFRHRVSHTADVTFQPTLTLSEDGTGLELNIQISNHRSNPFGYTYLCHVNWPLFEGGQLVQQVPFDDQHFELAPHPAQEPATAAYLEGIRSDLRKGDSVDPQRRIVPEYCAILRPTPDADGWAHFMQTRPDGRAACVSYETEHLPLAIRWISNTGEEQAAGFCLPASAHHRGRAAADRDGLVRWIPGGSSVAFNIEVDFFDPDETAARLL
ncbi:aldose 1-epimerase family protein [Tessaracoccus lubricantis]|uniref:Aldose 1-epimerase family protein n=1 Tax=Tessaracoccus lubricantis TaxID=545543 RepID=A0ABP9FM97_9ACTN